MTVQRLDLVAPGGGRLRVELPGDAPVCSVAAGVRFAGGSYGASFQIGPRGYHDFATTNVVRSVLRDRISVHGREVVVHEAEDRSSSVATLIGDYHELMTVYAGPAPRRDRITALFDSLRIVDTVPGMTVRPAAATLLDTMSEHLIVVVKDRGAISVPGPRQARNLLPKYAGARTKYGEVWKVAYPGVERPQRPGDHAYILGCPAGLAEVHLTAAGRVDDAELLGWLDGINVAWTG